MTERYRSKSYDILKINHNQKNQKKRRRRKSSGSFSTQLTRCFSKNNQCLESKHIYASKSLHQNNKYSKPPIRRCRSTSLYQRDSEHALLHRLQTDKFAPLKSSNQSNIANSRTFAMEKRWNNLKILNQWISQYKSDKASFRSIETFTAIKLAELKTSHCQFDLPGIKNRLKTAVCCDLMQDLMATYMTNVNQEITQIVLFEIFQAIYSDLPCIENIEIKHFCKAMPYFIISQRIQQELEQAPLKDQENELNMRLIKGAVSIREKLRLMAALRQDKEAIPIDKVFKIWKEYASLKKWAYVRAAKKLSKCLTLVRISSKVNVFQEWKNVTANQKNERQGKTIQAMMNKLKSQRTEYFMLTQELAKAEEKKQKLHALLVEQQNKKDDGIPVERFQALQKFESYLQDLRYLRTEFIALPESISNVGALMNDPNEDLMEMFDEEIALKWLKYQLQLILKSVTNDYKQLKNQKKIDEIHSKKKHIASVKTLLHAKSFDFTASESMLIPQSPKGDGSRSFRLIIEEDMDDESDVESIFFTPTNGTHEQLSMYNFKKLIRIIEYILEDDFKDFGDNFEGGQMWLILSYFVFDGADFDSLSQLLQLIKYSHPHHQDFQLVAEKICSLFHQYMDPQKQLERFVNISNLQSNNKVMNFVMLLKFIDAKPNILLKSEHIKDVEFEMKKCIESVSSLMAKLMHDTDNNTFENTGRKIEENIKKIYRQKKQLLENDKKWTAVQNKFRHRVIDANHICKTGKLNHLYEPTFPHYVIQNVSNIPFAKVKRIYFRCFKTENKRKHDFGLMMSALNDGMSIIYKMLKKYGKNKGTKLSFAKWEKIIYEFKLLKHEQAYKQIFCELSESGILSSANAKTLSNKFNRARAQTLSMDSEYFGLLLIYVSHLMYSDDAHIPPSVKLRLLLQQHLLPIIHPKSEIIALCNINAIRLLQREKRESLNKIWQKCQEIEQTFIAKQIVNNNLVKTVSSDAVTRFLRSSIDTSVYSKLLSLCQTCSNYQNQSRMDKEGLFKVVCGSAQLVKREKSSWMSIQKGIASFIDTLCIQN